MESVYLEMATVGEVLKELREARGWTQGQLGIKSGVTRETISAAESNRTNLSAAKLTALANCFGSDGDRLFEAAGLKRSAVGTALTGNQELDNLIIYLEGKNPTPAQLRQLQRLAKSLLEENEDIE